MIETMKEVAVSTIDSLKSNPLIFALLVFNLLILGAIYVAARESRNHLAHQMDIVLERCLPNVNVPKS